MWAACLAVWTLIEGYKHETGRACARGGSAKSPSGAGVCVIAWAVASGGPWPNARHGHRDPHPPRPISPNSPILSPPKPYLVLRDTLCPCEAHGMRPMYKGKNANAPSQILSSILPPKEPGRATHGTTRCLHMVSLSRPISAEMSASVRLEGMSCLFANLQGCMDTCSRRATQGWKGKPHSLPPTANRPQMHSHTPVPSLPRLYVPPVLLASTPNRSHE